jgi:membrane protease subunit HflC
MRRTALTVVIGAVLIIIFTLLLFVFQVRKSETAVVTTFGKPSAHAITEPGAYFKWPWPIQKVYKYDQRVQNFEDKYSPNYTADSVILLSSIYVGWKISDAGLFIQNFPKDASVSVPIAQQQLEGILRTARSAVIGKHTLSEFVNADPKALQFDAIEKEIEQAVQSELQTNHYGIQIEFLGFKKIGLPESITQSVFARMTSDREILINQYKYEGEARAQEIKSAADRQASETINNAVADATRIRGEGEAEAAKVLPVFQQNPELANFLLRIDAIQQSLNKRTTLIFDERTPPFDLFTGLPADQPAKTQK